MKLSNSLMTYNNYHAQIQYDSEDNIFYGSVIGTNDRIGFHGSTVDELRERFKNTIDEYIELCKSIGKEPEKEYSGTFNVRIKPETHKKLYQISLKKGMSLNRTVDEILTEYVEDGCDPTKVIVMINQNDCYSKAMNGAIANFSSYSTNLQSKSITALYAQGY